MVERFRVTILAPNAGQIVHLGDKALVFAAVLLLIRIAACLHDRFLPPEMIMGVVDQFLDDLIRPPFANGPRRRLVQQ